MFGSNQIDIVKIDEKNPVYNSRNNSNAIIETNTNTLICGFNKTVIPQDIKKIGIQAFSDCINIKSIEIPNSVT